MTAPPPRTIGSVETSLDIVTALQKRDGATVTELADDIGKTKGTIHTHLATLRTREFVVKSDGQYRLSLRFLDLGEYVRACAGDREAIRNAVVRLNDATGELAQFVVEEHGYATPVDLAEGEHSVSPPADVGDRDYLHCCASGKAILAFLPRDAVEEIVDRHGLPQSTSNTVASRDALFDQLAEVRRDGYAVAEEERAQGLCSIAAPVRTGDDVRGALSLVGPASRLRPPRIDSVLPNQITEYANVLQLSLDGGT